jgi:hypothetical protein
MWGIKFSLCKQTLATRSHPLWPHTVGNHSNVIIGHDAAATTWCRCHCQPTMRRVKGSPLYSAVNRVPFSDSASESAGKGLQHLPFRVHCQSPHHGYHVPGAPGVHRCLKPSISSARQKLDHFCPYLPVSWPWWCDCMLWNAMVICAS